MEGGFTILLVDPIGSLGRLDQNGIMAPARALRGGSSYLVVGRPVTRADDPAAVLQRIEQELLIESGEIQ